MITKINIGASNNYWCTEDMLVITSIKDTHNGITVQFPNIATINETKAGILPLSISLSIYTKKAHVFDGLYSSLLIYLCELCDNDYIAILDNNEINILK